MNKKISELIEATNIENEDVLMIIQNSQNKKAKIVKLIPIIEDTIDKKTVVKRYVNPAFYAESGDKISTGFRYEVGNDSLEVYYCGTKLIKDVDYEEDGTAGQTTTWIKMLDTIGNLDMSDVEGFEDFEETLEFVVRR